MEELFATWGLEDPQTIARWFSENGFSEEFLKTCTFEEVKPSDVEYQQDVLFGRNFVLWATPATPATPIVMEVINESEFVENPESLPGPSGLQQAVIQPSVEKEISARKSLDEAKTTLEKKEPEQITSPLTRSLKKISEELPSTERTIRSIKSLKYALLRSPHAPAIFASYDKHKCLQGQYQNYVANEILRLEIKETEGYTILPSRFQELARYVVGLFPPIDKQLLGEDDNPEYVWYVPSRKLSEKKYSSPRGKLVNRYHALRKELITTGVIDSRRKKGDIADPVPEDAAIPKDIADQKNWLSRSTKPHETAKAYWIATAGYRLQEFEKEKLTDVEYIARYPILKTAAACEMLLLDFKYKHDKFYDSLIKIWPSFKTKFIDHIKGNKAILNSLRELGIDITEADEDQSTIHILRALAFVLGVAKDIPGTKQVWNTTKKETIDGFISVVDSPAAVKPKIEARKKHCEKYGLKFQPYPLCVIQKAPLPTESYVVFSGKAIPVESPLSAIDTCFKIYQMLWLEYPPESIVVWNFVQKVLFKFSTHVDKHYMSVRNLATKLGL